MFLFLVELYYMKITPQAAHDKKEKFPIVFFYVPCHLFQKFPRDIGHAGNIMAGVQ